MTAIYIIVVTDIIYAYVIIVSTLSLFLSDAIEECKVECMFYCKIIKYYNDPYQTRQVLIKTFSRMRNKASEVT